MFTINDKVLPKSEQLIKRISRQASPVDPNSPLFSFSRIKLEIIFGIVTRVDSHRTNNMAEGNDSMNDSYQVSWRVSVSGCHDEKIVVTSVEDDDLKFFHS